MPKLLLPAVSSLVALALLATSAMLEKPRTADALTNCNVSDLSVDSEEAAFLTLINAYRAGNGAPALTMSANLNRSASWMALDMGTKNYFSHTDSLDRASNVRMSQCDVVKSGTAENIAAGTSWDTAQEVFNAWKNSSGHNKNMLNASYRQIGISREYVAGSRYGWYWVTDFSSAVDGTSVGGSSGASGGSTGGSGTTTPPPPPPAAAADAAAELTTPAPGTQLDGRDVTFGWDAGTGAREYFLYVGTREGANNIYGRSTGTSRSVRVYGLPTDGRTLYVRLWTLLSDGWHYSDYTYRAAN